MVNTSTFTVFDEKRHIVQEISGIDSNRAVLVWDEKRRIARLASKDDEKMNFYEGNFVEVSFSSSNQRYNFKPNTQCLDITNEPGPYAALLEKIDFVLLKLDIQRLRNSTADVQEFLMTGLLINHFYGSGEFDEDGEYFPNAVKNLPGFTNKDMQYFLMLERRTGQVAGAIFSRFQNLQIKLVSVVIDADYRNQAIGGIFLQSVMLQLQHDKSCSEFRLISSPKAVSWYKSYGFTEIHKVEKCPRHEPACRHFSLSLQNQAQNDVFIRRAKGIAFSLFSAAMEYDEVGKVKQLLPVLQENPPVEKGKYKPNSDVIERLNPSELRTLLAVCGTEVHLEVLEKHNPIDLLEVWPLESAPFPYLKISQDDKSLVETLDAAEKRGVAQLAKKALLSAPNVSDASKARFASLDEIRASLRIADTALKTIRPLVPHIIYASYVATSPHSQTKRPLFTIRADAKYGLEGFPELQKVTAALLGLESKIRQFPGLSEKMIAGTCEVPSFLKFQAATLRRDLERFLPVVVAKPGTVFTYVDTTGKETRYEKLSARCFASIEDGLNAF